MEPGKYGHVGLPFGINKASVVKLPELKMVAAGWESFSSAACSFGNHSLVKQ